MPCARTHLVLELLALLGSLQGLLLATCEGRTTSWGEGGKSATGPRRSGRPCIVELHRAILQTRKRVVHERSHSAQDHQPPLTAIERTRVKADEQQRTSSHMKNRPRGDPQITC